MIYLVKEQQPRLSGSSPHAEFLYIFCKHLLCEVVF